MTNDLSKARIIHSNQSDVLDADEIDVSLAAEYFSNDAGRIRFSKIDWR